MQKERRHFPLRGREEKHQLPGKGQNPRQGCHQQPLRSAGLRIHADFKGRGGEDKTLAGSRMCAEEVQGGELEARGFLHLSILTSSWAPAKDKMVGVSAKHQTQTHGQRCFLESHPCPIPPLSLCSSLHFLPSSASASSLVPNLILRIPVACHLVDSPALQASSAKTHEFWPRPC